MVPAIALAILLAAQRTPNPAPVGQSPAPASQQGTSDSQATSAPPTSQEAPRPSPDANGNYHIGDDGVSPPKIIHKVDPKFPKEARKQRGLDGVSVVGLVIDADGNSQNVRIVHSFADTTKPKYVAAAKGLDDQAVEAVKQYRFAPATFQGKPVPVEINVEVRFQIF